jgi:hypothetical protein
VGTDDGTARKLGGNYAPARVASNTILVLYFVMALCAVAASASEVAAMGVTTPAIHIGCAITIMGVITPAVILEGRVGLSMTYLARTPK